MTKIGKNIQDARKRMGLTQEELATRLGYKSKSTINKIELGINDIPQSKIVKFAEVLGSSPAALMGWVDEKTSAKNTELVQVIAKMRKDPEFFEVVSMLADLPADHYTSIKNIIAALGKK